MKVAFYLGSLNRGGAETLLLNIFQHHDILPFEAIGLYRNEGNLSEEYHKTTVPLMQIQHRHSWLLYCIKLRRQLKQQKVDIIHAQNSFCAIVAILCTAFTPIKVVNTFHGFSFASAPTVLKKIVFRCCKDLIFVSHYEQQYYLNKCPYAAIPKCHVVHNGIDFSQFELLNNTDQQHSPIKMCMVGSFGEGRNHLFICHVLNDLKKKGISFKFYFIGAARSSEKKIYDDCTSYCKDNGLDTYVEFMGLRKDVPKLLTTMDAFVYATRHDSFGIALVEAIATGLPTFVNDWGVMKELTENGKLATIYNTEDIESISHKLEHFIKNVAAYKQKAHENAIIIREKYSIEKHISKLFQIYERSMTS